MLKRIKGWRGVAEQLCLGLKAECWIRVTTKKANETMNKIMDTPSKNIDKEIQQFNNIIEKIRYDGLKTFVQELNGAISFYRTFPLPGIDPKVLRDLLWDERVKVEKEIKEMAEIGIGFSSNKKFSSDDDGLPQQQ